jgi:rhamnulokinase
MHYFAAVDLGATSGRVAVGSVSADYLNFEILHRFPNHIIQDKEGSFLWDFKTLFEEVLNGLRLASRKYILSSVAVDTWAVDYALYNEEWEQNAPIYSYRDSRTDGVMESMISQYGKSELYKNTGIAFLPFNTIFQLIAAQQRGDLATNARFLMLPDVINHLLVGSHSNEITNASSSQLLNATTRDWDWDLIEEIGLPRSLFPQLHEAETTLGVITQHKELSGIDVVAIGSHDTASAVAAIPMLNPEDTIYISSGTWSLVGCELDHPVISDVALSMNLTNELGVGNKVRLLKNVAGMWIISQLLAEWQVDEPKLSILDLVQEAKSVITPARFDPNDPIFLHPGEMSDRILIKAFEYSQINLLSRAEIIRSVYESLAESYARTITEISIATGKRFTAINIVGGGSANDFLNQLTANATGLQVTAGPVEATLLGNIGVQAIRKGIIKDLAHLRKLVSTSYPLRHFDSRN